MVDALISTAYAQASASPASPTVTTTAVRFKSIAECGQCELWFADQQGRIISKEILLTPGAAQAFELPKGAAAVGVADPKSNFELFQIPKQSETPLTITFDRKYSPLKDLRRDLGDYDIRSYDPELKLTK